MASHHITCYNLFSQPRLQVNSLTISITHVLGASSMENLQVLCLVNFHQQNVALNMASLRRFARITLHTRVHGIRKAFCGRTLSRLIRTDGPGFLHVLGSFFAREMWGKWQELWDQNWVPGSRWNSDLSSPSFPGRQSMSFTVDWMFLFSSVFFLLQVVQNDPYAAWDRGKLVCHVMWGCQMKPLICFHPGNMRADLCYTVTPLFWTQDSLSLSLYAWEESNVFCKFYSKLNVFIFFFKVA
jgi:hypothetical protein